MKTPDPAPPPPDTPGKGGRDAGSYDESDPSFAARKRLEALEAVQKSRINRGEESNREKNNAEKGSSKE